MNSFSAVFNGRFSSSKQKAATRQLGPWFSGAEVKDLPIPKSCNNKKRMNEKNVFQLNWFWMRCCLPPVCCHIEKCVRAFRRGGIAHGSIKFQSATLYAPGLPHLALIDFCVDICARLSRALRPSLAFGGVWHCFSRRLTGRTSATVCCCCCARDSTINALCCH